MKNNFSEIQKEQQAICLARIKKETNRHAQEKASKVLPSDKIFTMSDLYAQGAKNELHDLMLKEKVSSTNFQSGLPRFQYISFAPETWIPIINVDNIKQDSTHH